MCRARRFFSREKQLLFDGFSFPKFPLSYIFHNFNSKVGKFTLMNKKMLIKDQEEQKSNYASTVFEILIKKDSTKFALNFIRNL